MPKQTFSFHGFRFEVLRKQRNRIAALRIAPLAPRRSRPASAPSADVARRRGLKRGRTARVALAARLPYIDAHGAWRAEAKSHVKQSRRRSLAAAGAGSVGPGAGRFAPAERPQEWLRRLQEGLRGVVSGGGGGLGGLGMRGVVLLALVALLVWFALGSFYSVQPNEVGINLVFGRYTGKTGAGLNTNWPWPVGTVIHVPVWDQQITEVGYHGDANSADNLAESLMLTGDQNIVDVHFRVIWQIDSAYPAHSETETAEYVRLGELQTWRASASRHLISSASTPVRLPGCDSGGRYIRGPVTGASTANTSKRSVLIHPTFFFALL